MSNSWQSNRVGPYLVLRRLRGVTTAQEVGRVYAAVRQSTGRPALLVHPTHPGQWHPESEWRLRVCTGTGPASYLAVEVEHAPEGKAPAAQLAEGLDALTTALEGVERHPEVAAHLMAPPAPRKVPVRTWAPVLLAAAAAVFGGLLVMPHVLGPADPPAPAQETPVAVAEDALAEPEALPVAETDGRPERVALDMPKRLFPRQYRVDKDGKCKGRAETPINGGCWVLLGKLTPPCGDDAYEWKGGCYWPSIPAAKEPSSTLPPRTPPAPAQRSQ